MVKFQVLFLLFIILSLENLIGASSHGKTKGTKGHVRTVSTPKGKVEHHHEKAKKSSHNELKDQAMEEQATAQAGGHPDAQQANPKQAGVIDGSANLQADATDKDKEKSKASASAQPEAALASGYPQGTVAWPSYTGVAQAPGYQQQQATAYNAYPQAVANWPATNQGSPAAAVQTGYTGAVSQPNAQNEVDAEQRSDEKPQPAVDTAATAPQPHAAKPASAKKHKGKSKTHRRSIMSSATRRGLPKDRKAKVANVSHEESSASSADGEPAAHGDSPHKPVRIRRSSRRMGIKTMLVQRFKS